MKPKTNNNYETYPGRTMKMFQFGVLFRLSLLAWCSLRMYQGHLLRTKARQGLYAAPLLLEALNPDWFMA
eukprot:2743916-Amphidinium_carterae.1